MTLCGIMCLIISNVKDHGKHFALECCQMINLNYRLDSEDPIVVHSMVGLHQSNYRRPDSNYY